MLFNRTSPSLNRRQFVSGSTALAGLSLYAAPSIGQTAPAGSNKKLVVIFLDGGFDGLHGFAPALDLNYQSSRPTIAVQSSGQLAGYNIGNLDGVSLFMPPEFEPLQSLYSNNQMAVVHAVGHRVNDRSHFICRERYELGINEGTTPSDFADSNIQDGWLSRLARRISPANPSLPFVANHWSPTSVRGLEGATVFGDRYPTLGQNLTGDAEFLNAVRAANSSGDTEQIALTSALGDVEELQDMLANIDVSQAPEIPYPTTDFGNRLSLLAILMKQNSSIQLAQVDQLGWDTHAFHARDHGRNLSELAEGISAFWADLGDLQNDTVIVTLTEFGRRVEENGSIGTDHGLGTAMMVIGDSVNGGTVYGTWPGIAPGETVNGDLDITTDYRSVLVEVAQNHLAVQNSASVFPDLETSEQLGLFGSTTPPNQTFNLNLTAPANAPSVTATPLGPR